MRKGTLPYLTHRGEQEETGTSHLPYLGTGWIGAGSFVRSFVCSVPFFFFTGARRLALIHSFSFFSSLAPVPPGVLPHPISSSSSSSFTTIPSLLFLFPHSFFFLFTVTLLK